MKLMKRTAIAASILASFVGTSQVAADWSANLGVMSEYHFRGLLQNTSATANGGVDYENGGFSFGVWAADVEDGLEIDIYGGYGIELDNGLSLGIGYTTYQYTDVFDSEYNEVNLSAGFGAFSLEYSIGTQGDDAALGIVESDYTFTAVTYESEAGIYVTYGTFGDEFDGDYHEIGYGTSVNDFDVGISYLSSDANLNGDQALYFTLSKSIDL